MNIKLGEKTGKKIPFYVDGELIGSLYTKEVNTYSLEDEGEISESEYERILDETLLPRAKRYTMNLLIKSDKTETEIKRKLKQAGYGEAVSDAAIEYVRSYHYIDELRTAESFIRSKMDYSSEKEIRYKLSEKGVNDETIDLAYDQIIEELNSLETSDEDAGEGNTGYMADGGNIELKAAVNFVRKKLGSRLDAGLDCNSGIQRGFGVSNDTEKENSIEASGSFKLSYEEKQKLMAAAFRKGFRNESIRQALKNIINE